MSDPTPDFIGDGPEQAVTQCCEGCVALQIELRAAERRYNDLIAAIAASQDEKGLYANLDAALERHDRERKEADDEASK